MRGLSLIITANQLLQSGHMDINILKKPTQEEVIIHSKSRRTIMKRGVMKRWDMSLSVWEKRSKNTQMKP